MTAGPLVRFEDRRAATAPGSLRRHNLSLILRLLTDEGPRTRATLAEATGLTKATVSRLVTDLADRGFVRDGSIELAPGRGARPGRPGTPVEVSDRRVVGIGLTVDVGSVAAAAVDLHGRIHHHATRAVAVSASADEATDALADLTTALLADLHADGRLAVGTTVGVPGLVSGGRVLVAPNLGWPESDLGGHLAARVGQVAGPVLVDNEANLGAVATARGRRGGSGDERTFLYVSAGVGVGAAVVIDGEVLRGAHGFGGELGHLVIDPAGARCRCGSRGCLETVIGLRAVRPLLEAAPTTGPTGPTGPTDPTDPTGPRGEAHPTEAAPAWVVRAGAAAAAGDPGTVAALTVIADALAAALAAAVSLLDPEAIVLGGYLTALTPWLAPRVEARLAARVLGSRWERYPVRESRLGPLATLIGAGWRSLHTVLADPLLVPPSGGRWPGP